MKLLLITLSIIILTIFGCRGKAPLEDTHETSLQTDLLPPEEASLPKLEEETGQGIQREVRPAVSLADSTVRTSVLISRPFSELSARLPKFGVNVTEINPVNYQKADPVILREIGMDQYLISFISAERMYRDGNYRGAITEYSRSIVLKSDYVDALEGRGNAMLKTGEINYAIEDYTRVINLKMNRGEVYNYRGFAYAERGETEKAIADFTQALRIKPNYADALANRSRAFYQSGNYREAINDCTRLIALEPENFTAWNRRGSSWYSQNDDNRAIADFSKAITIKPDFALALHNRGNAWYSKGDIAKALTDIETAITIDPNFTAARSSRDYILQSIEKKWIDAK